MQRGSLEQVDLCLQGLFVVACLLVLLAKFNSGLSGFLKYGKTLTIDTDEQEDQETHYNFMLRFALELKVPKIWFFHFYVLSLVLATVGFVVTHTRMVSKDTSHPFTIPDFQNVGTIPLEISRFTFFLIIGHSARRFLESLWVFKYGKSSKMNISHYLVGVFFYTSLNLQLFLNTDFKATKRASPDDILLLMSLLLFLVASTDQFFNHAHLSSTKKYKVPRYGLFKYLNCAHYFDEILIYVAIFGILRTRTSFLILMFVIFNLSISAIETRNFYKRKESGKVPKWAIIPFLI